MLKKMLVTCAILLSSHAIAESAPDCSPDRDARIYLGLITSTDEANLKEEMNDIANNSDHLDIKQLSSTRMTLDEQRALMKRRARKNNYSPSDIVEAGLKAQYLQTHIFKQYYDIKSPSGLHIIAEVYSIPHNCGVDIGNIYFISKEIDGNTPSFADRAYTPY